MKDEAVFSGEDSSLTPVSAFDPDTGLGQKRSSARTRATIIDDRGPGAKLSGTNRAKTHPSGAGFCFLVGADKEAASLIVASDAGLFVHVHLPHPCFGRLGRHWRHGERMCH